MAREFDGVNDLLATGVSLTMPTTFSLAAWVYPRSRGEGSLGLMLAFQADPASANLTGFRIQAGTGSNQRVNFRADRATTSGHWHTPDDATTFILNAWQHVAVTYDGSSTANDPLMYVNGISVAVTEFTTPAGTLDTTADEIVIGNNDAQAATWDGYLAECCVWNRIITADEVVFAMRGGGLLVPSGLRNYWPLHGTISPEPDFSGTNQHMTVTEAIRVDHPPGVALWVPRARRIFVAPVIITASYRTLMGVGI